MQINTEDLEKAAAILMAPPSAVSTEERHASEQIFLQFRKTPSPFELGKQILKTCKVDYVLFETATLLKEAVIREWVLLQKQTISSLCTFILCCVTENQLQNYVREQLLQVVAIVFKLGTLEDPNARLELIEGLKQLLDKNEKSLELTCSSIMKALLNEYSITNQSSNFGRSLEFHSKCKKSFEEKDLMSVFLLTVDLLQRYSSKQLRVMNRHEVAIFNRYLSLAVQVFHWEFTGGNPLSLLRFPGGNETSNKVIFRPHKSWQNIMLNPDLIDLFFKLQQIASGQQELSHHCMQCLVQLASVAGPVFSTDEQAAKYLSQYIACFLTIASNTQKWSSHDAFGMANIVFRVVDVFPSKILKRVPQHHLVLLLQTMTHLTCAFQEASVHCQDDFENEYREAANIFLDSWVSVISHPEDYPQGIFIEHSLKVVSSYVKSHLAPPEGLRPNDTDDEEIDCEIVEMDRVQYVDELSNIGHLACQSLAHVLPVINAQMHARANSLQQMLVQLKQGNHNAMDDTTRINLFEDIHWLVMVASFMLTLDNSGESPQVPLEVVDFSTAFATSNPDSVAQSVAYLNSVGKNCSHINVDPILVTFVSILRFAEIQLDFLLSKLGEAFSPEISSTLFWFFRRWVQCYLPDKNTQSLSPILTACFDTSQACGQLVVRLLLHVVTECLQSVGAEPQTSDDVIKLFVKIMSRQDSNILTIAQPTLTHLAQHFINGTLTLTLPVTRQLIKCFMLVFKYQQDNQMHTNIIESILRKYEAVRGRADFAQVAHQVSVKENVVRTFECVRGMCRVMLLDTEYCQFIYKYVEPVIQDAVGLFKVYNTSADIVEAVLNMYVDVVEGLYCSLHKTNSTKLCKICIDMMKEYASHSLGASKSDEENKYADVLLLMKMLSKVLSKEYLDMGSDDNSDAEGTEPVDVVLYGLHIIIPLINQQLMKYPDLSNEYFKLVTFVCEVYPEKMSSLPLELFNNLMASIQLAISDYSADAAKCSLDALSSLARYFFNECNKSENLASAIKQFLKVVLEYVLLACFNMDLIEPAAECLFLLICCDRDEYMKLANQMIEEQHVTNESFQSKLVDAFQKLTPANLQLTPNRQSLRIFRKNLELFLQSVKGFLCVK